MAAPKNKVATLEGYQNLPIDAQMSLAFAAGRVPASATPDGYVSAGVSWGLITLNGDAVALTRYGSDMLDLIIAHKQQLDDAIESSAREEGGAAGGGYLDKIGVFDMASLSADQWDNFVRKICDAYLHARLKMIVQK